MHETNDFVLLYNNRLGRLAIPPGRINYSARAE